MHWLIRVGLAVALATTLAAAHVIPGESPTQASAAADWQAYNNTYDGERFSALRQINTSNIGSLRPKCRVEIAHRGAFQTGPVMIAGTLYVTTAFETVALDAATCRIKWRHSESEGGEAPLPVNRGVAYLDGRVFRGTVDAHLLALDAASGRVLWTDVFGESNHGTLITGAPLAWNGLVFVGVAVSELGIKGRIVAVDAASGREVWRFSTIPTGNEVGADTWVDRSAAEYGGGGTWSSFALDPDTAEIFIPVGNPAPDFRPQDRPGANLFTDSVLVLDARSGALRWWYQLVANDAQDRDLGAAPMLFRMSDDTSMVAAAGKDGYVHLIDRRSHLLVHKTAVTTISNLDNAPTPAGLKVCPGVLGGVEWNGPAFDREHQTVIVGAVDFCTILKADSAPRIYGPKDARLGGTVGVSSDVTATGWVTAIDPASGAIRWQYHAPAPVLAGVTVTAGGLVLTGDTAGNFIALDSATGKVLKTIATGGSLAGGVVTYEVRGRQYVAFACGNVSRTLFGALGRPSIVIMQADGSPTAGAASRGPDPERGHGLYLQSCAGCHGVSGGEVAGYDLKSVKSHMNPQRVASWIMNPAPPMPKAFPEPLDGEDRRDIRDIAAYLMQF